MQYILILQYIPILQYLVTPDIRITNIIAFTRKKQMCTHFWQIIEQSQILMTYL